MHTQMKHANAAAAEIAPIARSKKRRGTKAMIATPITRSKKKRDQSDDSYANREKQEERRDQNDDSCANRANKKRRGSVMIAVWKPHRGTISMARPDREIWEARSCVAIDHLRRGFNMDAATRPRSKTTEAPTTQSRRRPAESAGTVAAHGSVKRLKRDWQRTRPR